MSMFTVLLVIGILVLLIVAHELGHFIAAKIFRVQVEEFGVGYPPRALTFGKWGGTEYTLNWLPFGGFVRLFGDVGENKHGAGSLVDKNRGAQATILVAGVLMNALVAWLLFAIALSIGVPRVAESAVPHAHSWLLIAEVVPGSPAAAAGIASGDKLVQLVDGSGEEPEELTPEAVTSFVQVRGGEAIELTYERAGETFTTTMSPAHAVIPDEEERPALGILLVMVTTKPLPLLQAIGESFVSTVNAFEAVGVGLWNILKDAVSGGSALKSIVGPVGLVGIVGAAAESGVGNILALAAFISVNLVIINLLPIPALDGGRLFVLGVESIMRRDAPRLVLRLLNMIGIAFIVFLMVAVTYNDIVRLFA